MAKKRFVAGMLALALVFGMMVVGCGEVEKNSGGYTPPTYTPPVQEPMTGNVTVTIDADGGIQAPASPVTVKSGSTITQPPAMTKAWHTFGGWYTDSTRTVPALFPITVTANVNLYAKWVLNTFTTINDVKSYLASLSSDTKNPVDLTIDISLGTMTSAASGWQQLLGAINTSGKYVNLDLSACTMSGTSFGPDSSVATGKDKIVSIVLPGAAMSIWGNYYDYTFKNFSNLKSISGINIATIGEYAFRGCTGLQSVSLPQATSIGSYAFSVCTLLQSVNLPQAASIGYSAFGNCTLLQSVSLPQAASIGDSAFSGCTLLQSVSLPQATSIGYDAFRSCTGLQSLNIPRITNIDLYAFSNTGTTALVITMGSTAPTLGSQIFQSILGSKTVTVKVPTGAAGYTPFSGSTVTVSGTNTNANWANGFRGGGWNVTTWAGPTYINQYISLTIQQQ